MYVFPTTYMAISCTIIVSLILACICKAKPSSLVNVSHCLAHHTFTALLLAHTFTHKIQQRGNAEFGARLPNFCPRNLASACTVVLLAAQYRTRILYPYNCKVCLCVCMKLNVVGFPESGTCRPLLIIFCKQEGNTYFC